MDSNYDLEQSFNSSFKIFESFYETNDMENTISLTEPYAEYDINHSFVRSVFTIFKSCLTLDPEDIERASKSAAQTAQLCDKYRNRSLFDRIMKYLRTPDYNQYSEIEIHAELTFAMLMGYSAILGLVNSHTILDFIRIVNRLRLSKNGFKECRQIFQSRTEWESELSKTNFEAGISIERGCRHLIISLLPPKVLRLVNYFGYRGVRSIAFDELHKTAFDLTGVYSKFSESLLLIYHLYVETFISVRQKESIVVDNLVRNGLNSHPNSMAYKLFRAKSNQITGKIGIAVKQLEKQFGYNIKYFDKLSHFELMWCYAFKRDWDQCIKYSKLLRQFAIQSPIIFTYFEAVFLYVKSLETNNEKLKEEASELFRSIPTMRTLYFGFTPAFELICIEYSKLYFENNEFLILPVIELMYTYNYFITIYGNYSILKGLLNIVENEIQIYSQDLDDVYYADNYLSALFYKGVILKYMGKLNKAHHCFDWIYKQKDRINKCDSIIPQTVMELGLIQMLKHNYKKAKDLLNRVLDDYRGYSSELLLHTRIYPALREMGVNTDTFDVIASKIVEDYREVLPEVTELNNNNNRQELLRL